MKTTSLEYVRAILRDSKVSVITKQDANTVCVFHESMQLRTALQCLASRSILSAPVMSGTVGDPAEPMDVSFHPESDVSGFIDVQDILLAFLAGLEDTDALLKKPLPEMMAILQRQGEQFCEGSVRDVACTAQDGGFLHSIQMRVSLWEMVYTNMLYPRRRGDSPRRDAHATGSVHHRMAIFNSRHEITQVVSQSDIIRHLNSQRNRFPATLDAQIKDIPGLLVRGVITLPATCSAFEALLTMRSKNISAVAVVDDKGRFLGNFSTSQLRAIMAEEFGALAVPVAEFLPVPPASNCPSCTDSAELKSSPAAHFITKLRASHFARNSSYPYLEEHATFGFLLQTLVDRKVHRLYTVDSERRPSGVTTLTDILFAISGETAS